MRIIIPRKISEHSTQESSSIGLFNDWVFSSTEIKIQNTDSSFKIDRNKNGIGDGLGGGLIGEVGIEIAKNLGFYRMAMDASDFIRFFGY